MKDGLQIRLYRKALGNQVAIAVGSSCSAEEFSIPSLAEGIIKTFNVDYSVDDPYQYFQRWNDFVAKAEKRVSRDELWRYVHERVARAEPSAIHKKIASIPISNFIDTTFDRSLYKALLATGRKPILHDWHTGQMMGSWRQSNPEAPNLFFMLPDVIGGEHTFFGIYEPTGWMKQNRIQIENMREMLTEKDLVLVNYSPHEAEAVLHLYALDTAGEKVVNFSVRDESYDYYWALRGVHFRHEEADAFIDKLLPSQPGRYTGWDNLGRSLISSARMKTYDTFISYFSGDKEFVRRLQTDLRLREIRIWLDEYDIEVGDSISGKIQEGLSDSYSFIIVLSPEALSRAWVKEELRAAYALRLAGEFKILPVLHKECDIPPFLADYRYADFRDEQRYHEQLDLLERSIKNAVMRASGKK
jgi:hypothetical protein